MSCGEQLCSNATAFAIVKPFPIKIKNQKSMTIMNEAPQVLEASVEALTKIQQSPVFQSGQGIVVETPQLITPGPISPQIAVGVLLFSRIAVGAGTNLVWNLRAGMDPAFRREFEDPQNKERFEQHELNLVNVGGWGAFLTTFLFTTTPLGERAIDTFRNIFG
jgi:hypothetical protein